VFALASALQEQDPATKKVKKKLCKLAAYISYNIAEGRVGYRKKEKKTLLNDV